MVGLHSKNASSSLDLSLELLLEAKRGNKIGFKKSEACLAAVAQWLSIDL